MTAVWMIVMGAIILVILLGSVYAFTRPPAGTTDQRPPDDTSEGAN